MITLPRHFENNEVVQKNKVFLKKNTCFINTEQCHIAYLYLDFGIFLLVGGTSIAKISNMTLWNNVSQQLHSNYVLSVPSEENQGQSIFSIKLRVLQSTAQRELQAHYYQIYHC